MIINKGSMERGFKHGVVYKTKIVNAGGDGFEAKEWKYMLFIGFHMSSQISLQFDAYELILE